MGSLRRSTTKGVFWSFLDSFGAYFIKFGFSIAIARALSPGDYGVMGMIVIFISLGQILMMGGFSMALIQKSDATEKDFSTVFWYNLLVAVFVYALLFISSDYIALFFNSPILKMVTRVAGLGIIITSLSLVPLSLLSRKMDFKKQALVNLVSSLFSGIFGVFFAYKGFAVWALVIQTLAGNIVGTIGFWIVCSWRPAFIFDRQSFISLNRYGYKIFLQGLGDVLFTKIYFPLIGKYYPPAQLGYYTNASRFYDVFVRQVSNAFGRVLFPAFSSIQDDNERFNRNYLISSEILFFIAVPLTMVLIMASRPFVLIFLTGKWLPTVPLMNLFLLEGIFFPLLMLNHNILCSLGHSGASLKIDILKKALTFGSIFIAFRFGIRALIIGQLAGSFISYIVSIVVVNRMRKISYSKLMKSVILTLLVAGVCAAFYYFVLMKVISVDWVILLSVVSLIPLLYLGLSALLRMSALKEIKEVVRPAIDSLLGR